jgi:hypothetical protein
VYETVGQQPTSMALLHLTSHLDEMPDALWATLLICTPPCLVPIAVGTDHETHCLQPATGFLVRACDDAHFTYTAICDPHRRHLAGWLASGRRLECEQCAGPTAVGFALPAG